MSPQQRRAFLCCAITAISLANVPAMGQVQETVKGVSIVHGGIGEDARAAMLRMQERYNVRLQFAEQGSGAYLSGVRVKIADPKQQVVVDTLASGPWFYAQLPPGEYEVTAISEGRSLAQRIRIAANGGREWVFRFSPGAG